MWSERHRPRRISDMIGNEESRASVVEWFAKWRKGAKPLLLVGPPGIGKTTIAFLAAEQFGYDAISLNASDVRNKSQINEILRPVLGNVSVMGTPMIFIDEVDGIHGRSDYGGSAALVDILKTPAVPIVLAANSDAHDKMKGIKKATRTVEFRRIPPRLLSVYLQDILRREGQTLSPGSMVKVIDKSRGDIRSMANLAQAMATGFNPQTAASFDSIDAETGINAFFKANSADEARIILYSMQVDPREKINAFYSSVITADLDAASRAAYLRVISDADLLHGRILRTQNWRLLRYLNDTLVRLYRKDDRIRYTKYNLPFPLLNRIRWDGAKIRLLTSFIARTLHVSSSAAATMCLPYMLYCMKNGSLGRDLGEEFDATISKEIEALK